MSTTGRPASYSPDLCELAEFFGVSARTIDNWIADAGGLLRRHRAARRRRREDAPCRRLSGSAPPCETNQRGAERAERPKTSNPSEPAAFSTMAQRGGNRRKLAEPLVPVQARRGTGHQKSRSCL
jgi:hypothetical protein